MPLTKEQIDDLLGLVRVSKGGTRPDRKQIRIQTHFPKLPAGSDVVYSESQLRCTARRCSTPTWYKFRGMALCSHHMIDMLANEILLLRSQLKAV